jgi:hypothetical protein
VASECGVALVDDLPQGTHNVVQVGGRKIGVFGTTGREDLILDDHLVRYRMRFGGKHKLGCPCHSDRRTGWLNTRCGQRDLARS